MLSKSSLFVKSIYTYEIIRSSIVAGYMQPQTLILALLLLFGLSYSWMYVLIYNAASDWPPTFIDRLFLFSIFVRC